VGIKYFEENYKEYYKKCFNLNKFNLKNKIGGYDNPISITTNGYTVCILFERKLPEVNIFTEIKKSADKVINLDTYFKNSKGNDKLFKRGLFDADQCRASTKFLEKFNKTAIDPNNEDMLVCYDESGKMIKVTKGYYLEESHIHMNTKKMKTYIKSYQMDNLYRKLSEIGYKGTTSKLIYIKFIKLYRENHNKIWSFYSQTKILNLEFDTYVNKRKAIHNIARKIVPKRGKLRKYKNYKNKHIDDKIYNENKKKPQMIFFGKGNGSTTISNLRNSSPKGPIKSVAKELSQLCILVLTDEYNTSKISSINKEREVNYPIIKQEKTRRIKDPKTGKRKKIKVTIERKSHRLCYSESNTNLSEEKTDLHKIWLNRDYNSARNIFHVATCKLTGKRLGIFSRKKKSENYNDSQICFSLEKLDSEIGFQSKIKTQTNELRETQEQILKPKVKKQSRDNILIGKSNKKSNEKIAKNETSPSRAIIKISKKVINKLKKDNVHII